MIFHDGVPASDSIDYRQEGEEVKKKAGKARPNNHTQIQNVQDDPPAS
jgi:hypothetical protein